MTNEISRRAYIDQAPPILGEIAEMVVNGAEYRSEAMSVLHDAARALKRAAKRAEALSDDWQRVEIRRNFGRLIEFTGRLLAETTFPMVGGRGGGDLTFQLWETEQGAWIAAKFIDQAGRREKTSAVVIPPSEDNAARQDAAMDEWEWHDRARSMVRKELGWSLREDVE